MWKVLLTIAILAALLAFFGKAQGKYHLFQYLFFLRVQIGAALLLVLGPFFARQGPTSRTLANWFDLDGVGFGIVTLLSLLLAWVLMNKTLASYLLTAPRNHLVFSREAQSKAKASDEYKNPFCPFLSKGLGPFPTRLCIFSLLPIPLLYACFSESTTTGLLEKIAGIAVGLVVALALWALWRLQVQGRFLVYLRKQFSPERKRVRGVLRRALVFWTSEKFVEALFQGYEQQSTEIERIRLGTWLFFYLTAFLYLVGYFVLAPNNFPEWTETVPAMGYLLLLMILVVWILPTITLFLDKFRIPSLTIMVVASAIMTGLFGSDYTYKLTTAEDADDIPDAVEAYNGWQNRHPERERAIIITSSGGGITASYWTSLVVTELEKRLGPDFSQSLLLMSTTSGGSVGTMYIVNQFGENGLKPDKLDEIVEDAGRSSIGAAAWGIIYPDFWRFILGASPLLQDRAWAQEQIWQHNLAETDGDEPITMRSWLDGVKAGWRPPVAFNATIVETGEQLVISPIDLHPKKDGNPCSVNPADTAIPQARGLFDLYPGSDIGITTAARLSAAFPLVTPTARPTLEPDCNWHAFHVGDGGYYDNYGMLSAIQYLRTVLEKTDGKLKQVLVLQIRASRTEIELEPRRKTGLIEDLLTPLETIYNVRSASQVVNNERLLDTQIDYWDEQNRTADGGVAKASIVTCVVSLDADSPLSWYLSDSERNQINESWVRKQDKVKDFVDGFLTGTVSGNQRRDDGSAKKCEEYQLPS